jgi:hypothetical protein
MAAQKRPTKKSAKKATRKTTKKTAKKTPEKTTGQSDRPRRSAPRASAPSRPKPLELARRASEQLAELTGKQPEGATAIERDDDNWRIQLEVVESRRIPDSADILALYDVLVDSGGELLEYHRVRRYPRGRSDSGDGGGR